MRNRDIRNGNMTNMTNIHLRVISSVKTGKLEEGVVEEKSVGSEVI